jgi:RP/EB family microtubule-associated protein
MAQAIGMMEGAYFVGRVELLNWLNDFLQLDYKKVEQVCSGAAYCQLMDALYPGKVPLAKVNFSAKFEYEYLKNFSILQAAFDKVGIDKRIDVNTLIKGKFQDNLEFLQWMKKYFDMHYGGDPYDAVGRRGGKTGVTKVTPTPKKPVSKVDTKSPKGVPSPSAKPPGKEATKTKPSVSPTSDAGRIQQLEEKTEELQTIAAEVEKERDFYFGKLREIEILCQSVDANDLTEQIFRILSAQDDENGAGEEAPAEDDETF